MSAIRLVVGFLLLVTGTELHWLFVGAVVFLVTGLVPIQAYLPPGEQSTWRMVVSLTVLAILLALPFKRFMSGAASFLAGGFLALTLPGFLGYPGGVTIGWSFLAGGAAGLVLYWISPILALMILSTLIGSLLVVEGMPAGPFHPLVLFGLFFFTGLGIQYLLLQWGEPSINR